MKVSRRAMVVAGGGLVAAALGVRAVRRARRRAAAAVPPPPPTPGQARLGINLAAPTDYNSELPFIDVFRTARDWLSQREGGSFGEGPVLDFDPQGWVTRLQPGCWAETILLTGLGELGHTPPGLYTILYEGQGRLELWGGELEVKSDRPGRMQVQLQKNSDPFYLRVRETKPGNHLRNIRVLLPGFAEKQPAGPWNPSLLARWKGVAAVRFMDFMLTNGSATRSWGQRPKVEDATFSRRGVPVELMVDLANRLGADPWFCMPHMADDEYVRSFARLVKERLQPARKVYLEYSNEVWNGMFPQSAYATQQGQRRQLGERPWEAAWGWVAHRSMQMFRIWEEVMGRQRLVRVLASQAGSIGVAEYMLGVRDAVASTDALAIAPYFGSAVDQEGAAKMRAVSVDDVLAHLEKNLEEAIGYVREHKRLADKHGLRLVAYEGGQHLVGIQGAENDERLARLFNETNRHPRMGALYDKYYAAWTQAGGDLLCHFSSVSVWSKWGSWGLLQFQDEDPRQSPKFMATMKWARSRRQQVGF
jgi:hypothetical protein